MRRAMAWWGATGSRPPAGGPSFSPAPIVSPHFRPPEPSPPVEHDKHAIELEVKIEAEVRARIADELHKMRFDGGIGAVPDMYFWGITHAERLVRGEA